MKNYEKYAEEMRKYDGSNFCKDFIIPHVFNSEHNCRNINCIACRMLQTIWLFEECEESEEPKTDWSKVEVDTPILVRDDESQDWDRRHFSKYVNGVVCAWDNGHTSWTASDDCAWKYTKLAESEEE